MADEKITRAEILAALKQAGQVDSPDREAWMYGPMQVPFERWRHLPDWKRKWFEDRSREELDLMVESLNFYRRFREWGRVTKWLVLTMLAIVVGVSQFGDAVTKMLGWVKVK